MKKRRDTFRSSLIRACRKLVFVTLTTLCSIGDYKHVLVARYAAAYTTAADGLREVMAMAGIQADFLTEELMSMYMNRGRIAPLCPTSAHAD